MRKKKKYETTNGKKKKRLRSAFHGATGRADRLTERAEASGQSLVSSWRDRTRPVRADRKGTESGQRSTREPNKRDRTRR
jgi:hypothetical protein